MMAAAEAKRRERRAIFDLALSCEAVRVRASMALLPAGAKKDAAAGGA